MLRSFSLFFLWICLSFPNFTFAQGQPTSDPQALAYAAQSIAAMTGGATLSDVTLTGTVTWNGPSAGTGTATLRALGTGESRMDLALATGTRTEIRDAQTGGAIGEWYNPNNTSGSFAPHNCQTDAVWFFPVLGSLAARQNVVLSNIGETTWNGVTVQHVQSYLYGSNWPAGVTPTLQQLSTIDFYLDATTFLPVAVTFNAHPDNHANTNLRMEVDFSSYRSIAGVTVPTHIERYQQGALMVDLTVNGASFNSGLSLSIFTIN